MVIYVVYFTVMYSFQYLRCFFSQYYISVPWCVFDGQTKNTVYYFQWSYILYFYIYAWVVAHTDISQTTSTNDLSWVDNLYSDESHLTVDTPVTPAPPQPQPYEVMRQVTRRATIRRSRKSSAANKVPPNEKLEAIKRGQKLLDARLAVNILNILRFCRSSMTCKYVVN